MAASQLTIVPNGWGHAGQRRYHDYPKLRELHQKRMATRLNSLNNSNSRMIYSNAVLSNTKCNVFGSQSHANRSFFNFSRSAQPLSSNSLSSSSSSFFSQNPFNKAMKNMQLKRLERTANANQNDANAHYAFLMELSIDYPTMVIARMRHPQFKQHAIDINCAVLYLNALQQTSQVNQFDLDDVIKRLSSSAGKGAYLGTATPASLFNFQSELAAHKPSKKDQLQQLLNLLMSAGAVTSAAGSTLGGSGGRLAGSAGAASSGSVPLMTRGLNPWSPLHVTVVPRDLPGGAIRLIAGFAGKCALFLAVFALISSALEDLGPRGLLPKGKHVQEDDGASHRDVKFDDVKGVTEAKAELEEIVMFLKDPSKFTRLGGKLPRGLLLTGPPGTGKTLLAKAIAGEADVPFFFASGSQFEEMYVGLGAKRVRELFEAAKKKAPAIIFIDELDAVGGKRNAMQQSYSRMTLNELLTQLDGFDDNSGIIVVGATNMKDSLDAALLRPGRFDKHIVVPLPDVGGRKEILELYAKKMRLAKDVDLDVLARGTTGMSGADLFNLMNQAAIKASTDGLNDITMPVLEHAKDNIRMGVERKSAVTTAESARGTAYHEAGHALVGVLTEGGAEVHKATIVQRGNALGLVAMLPKADDTNYTYQELVAMMDMAMGGRVAEELIFGKEEISAGASSDIMQVTNIARLMVAQFGFSDAVGIVDYGEYESASEGTRALIDTEVKRMTDEAYDRAKQLLTTYSAEHKLLAETLLEYETLTGDEVRDVILKKQKPKRPVINTRGGARGDTTILKPQ